jgi:hypothetical protein
MDPKECRRASSAEEPMERKIKRKTYSNKGVHPSHAFLHIETRLVNPGRNTEPIAKANREAFPMGDLSGMRNAPIRKNTSRRKDPDAASSAWNEMGMVSQRV